MDYKKENDVQMPSWMGDMLNTIEKYSLAVHASYEANILSDTQKYIQEEENKRKLLADLRNFADSVDCPTPYEEDEWKRFNTLIEHEIQAHEMYYAFDTPDSRSRLFPPDIINIQNEIRKALLLPEVFPERFDMNLVYQNEFGNEEKIPLSVYVEYPKMPGEYFKFEGYNSRPSIRFNHAFSTDGLIPANGKLLLTDPSGNNKIDIQLLAKKLPEIGDLSDLINNTRNNFNIIMKRSHEPNIISKARFEIDTSTPEKEQNAIKSLSKFHVTEMLTNHIVYPDSKEDMKSKANKISQSFERNMKHFFETHSPENMTQALIGMHEYEHSDYLYDVANQIIRKEMSFHNNLRHNDKTCAIDTCVISGGNKIGYYESAILTPSKNNKRDTVRIVSQYDTREKALIDHEKLCKQAEHELKLVDFKDYMEDIKNEKGDISLSQLLDLRDKARSQEAKALYSAEIIQQVDRYLDIVKNSEQQSVDMIAQTSKFFDIPEKDIQSGVTVETGKDKMLTLHFGNNSKMQIDLSEISHEIQNELNNSIRTEDGLAFDWGQNKTERALNNITNTMELELSIRDPAIEKTRIETQESNVPSLSTYQYMIESASTAAQQQGIKESLLQDLFKYTEKIQEDHVRCDNRDTAKFFEVPEVFVETLQTGFNKEQYDFPFEMTYHAFKDPALDTISIISKCMAEPVTINVNEMFETARQTMDDKTYQAFSANTRLLMAEQCDIAKSPLTRNIDQAMDMLIMKQNAIERLNSNMSPDDYRTIMCDEFVKQYKEHGLVTADFDQLQKAVKDLPWMQDEIKNIYPLTQAMYLANSIESRLEHRNKFLQKVIEGNPRAIDIVNHEEAQIKLECETILENLQNIYPDVTQAASALSDIMAPMYKDNDFTVIDQQIKEAVKEMDNQNHMKNKNDIMLGH